MNTCNTWEELRLKYKPERVRVLLISVSPPRRRFFHKRNSLLYQSVFEAFNRVFNVSEYAFLEFFKDLGFYLVDLFPQECGSKIPEIEYRVKENKELKISTINYLKRVLVDEKPRAIIVCFDYRRYPSLREIINESIKQSKLVIQLKHIPFPQGKHFKRSVQELIGVLKVLVQVRVIPKG